MNAFPQVAEVSCETTPFAMHDTSRLFLRTIWKLIFFCLLGGFGFSAAAGAPSTARPNILIILADDVGVSDLGC